MNEPTNEHTSEQSNSRTLDVMIYRRVRIGRDLDQSEAYIYRNLYEDM